MEKPSGLVYKHEDGLSDKSQDAAAEWWVFTQQAVQEWAEWIITDLPNIQLDASC